MNERGKRRGARGGSRQERQQHGGASGNKELVLAFEGNKKSSIFKEPLEWFMDYKASTCKNSNLTQAHGKLQLSIPLDKVIESKLSLMNNRKLAAERTGEDRRKRKERKAAGVIEFEKRVEGSRVAGGDPGRVAVRVTNNGWAADRLHSTVAGEENFLLSSTE